MFARLAFVCCLLVFQHQLVASYRINLGAKKYAYRKYVQARSAQARSEAESEANVSATLGRFRGVGAGTLMSASRNYYRTSQWSNIGSNLWEAKFSLEEACVSMKGCVGFHVMQNSSNGRYLQGALLLDRSGSWPMPTPPWFDLIGASKNWEGFGDSQERYPADFAVASVQAGKGWGNGWQAYAWHNRPGTDCVGVSGGTVCSSCAVVARLGSVGNCQDWCAHRGYDCASTDLHLTDSSSCNSTDIFRMPFCSINSDHNNYQRCTCKPWSHV